jgi:hypothetical protein
MQFLWNPTPKIHRNTIRACSLLLSVFYILQPFLINRVVNNFFPSFLYYLLAFLCPLGVFITLAEKQVSRLRFYSTCIFAISICLASHGLASLWSVFDSHRLRCFFIFLNNLSILLFSLLILILVLIYPHELSSSTYTTEESNRKETQDSEQEPLLQRASTT